MRKLVMKFAALFLATALTIGMGTTTAYAAPSDEVDVQTEQSSISDEEMEVIEDTKGNVSDSLANGQAVVNYACQFIGNPYRYGGSSLTKGTDCSGFVMSVYKNFGVSLRHSSSAMRKVGKKVKVSEMQPGDIVCYSGHVAIYIGGGQIVHAATRRSGIKISKAKYAHIICVRRVF